MHDKPNLSLVPSETILPSPNPLKPKASKYNLCFTNLQRGSTETWKPLWSQVFYVGQTCSIERVINMRINQPTASKQRGLTRPVQNWILEICFLQQTTQYCRATCTSPQSPQKELAAASSRGGLQTRAAGLVKTRWLNQGHVCFSVWRRWVLSV